jgi:quinol monooxygenase YgiN
VPHGRITTITFTPGGLEQIWEMVPSFVDVLRQQPGFLSYQFFQTGPDAAVTIALYAEQDQSDAAAAAAATWIAENSAHLIVRRDVRPGTELLFEAATPERG